MSREMNIRWFACSLTVLPLLALWMPACGPRIPLHAENVRLFQLIPAADSPIRFTFQSPSTSNSTAVRRPNATRQKPWPAASPSSITTTTASSIFFSPTAPTSRRCTKLPQNIPDRLFENDGHGHFTDVTEKAGLAGTGYDTGVAIGDYDNDGYEDIFVAGVYRNTLYHNNGNGTFTDVTAKAGLNKPDPEYGPLWSVAAAWVDVNNDGLLDLIVLNYLKWDFRPRNPYAKDTVIAQ